MKGNSFYESEYLYVEKKSHIQNKIKWKIGGW